MSTPLADRIRPKTLDDVVGQEHILGRNKPLRKIIESGAVPIKKLSELILII